jgi:hypothetical protein
MDKRDKKCRKKRGRDTKIQGQRVKKIGH